MIYHIRKAHKDGVLEKYYCNFDRSLVVMKTGTTKKIRLTHVSNKSTNILITMVFMEELTCTILQK